MSSTLKFRHNASIAIAGLIALFGAVPIASLHWYLAPILLVPLAVLIWGWRAGTDADATGLSVRALLGRRRLAWSEIDGFVRVDRHVVATLADGCTLTLPAVAPMDLPRLIAASGTPLATSTDTAPDAAETGTSTDPESATTSAEADTDSESATTSAEAATAGATSGSGPAQ